MAKRVFKLIVWSTDNHVGWTQVTTCSLKMFQKLSSLNYFQVIMIMMMMNSFCGMVEPTKGT